MKLKKIFICLFVFSIFLTSCSSKEKKNSNVETNTEVKKENVEKVEFDEEIKNVEIPKNATEFRFLNYNPENNKLYFTYTSEDRIVYASKNLKDETTDIIYEIKGNEKENMFAIARDGVIDETLFIVKVNNKNVANNKKNNSGKETFEYNFIVVDKNKTIQKYFDEDKSSITNDNQVYNKIPSVTVDGHNLILTCENNIEKDIIKSYLIKFNIDDAHLTLLKEEELNTKNNKLNGKYIMFAGGFENTIYYQVVNYKVEENMEKESADICKYVSFDESKKVLELEKITTPEAVKNRKVIFVSGDDKFLFTSDYVIEASDYNTGKVINLETMESSEIPNVKSTHYLTDAYKINNFYLLDNNDNIYVYNKSGKLLIQKNYKEKGKSSSKMAISKNTISYLVRENDESKEAQLHILRIKAK